MNLTEHQAKKILLELGVNVPVGRVATSEEEALACLDAIPGKSWVIKAQIRAGGRAHGHFIGDPQARGGIRFATSADMVKSNVRQMLGGVLITDQTGPAGERVDSVYIEQQIASENEMYLALTIDRELGSLAFIVSAVGGSDIEALAQQNPTIVNTCPVDIESMQIPDNSDLLPELDDSQHIALQKLMQQMLTLFVERDASLIEINPLGVDSDGQLIALDAAISWDDNALFRQGHEEQLEAYNDLTDSEYTAMRHGLNYVKLAGNIGCLSAGAGLAMATVDAITECGGEPANFLDIPPSSTVERIRIAFDLLVDDPAVDSILLNVFGGGIMRCDAVTDAILLSNRERPLEKPVVVRLAGTNARLALQRLESSVPVVQISLDLADAASRVVALSANRQPAEDVSAPADRMSWLRRIQKRLIPG